MTKLGKGLDALIPGSSEAGTQDSSAITELPINLIDTNPHQPRTDFDEVGISELAASIKKHGILQPLVITKEGDHYQLIAGERRLRAASKAGLSKVPVIIRDVEDHEKLEIAIIENVQRANLNPIEEANSYRKLMEEFSYTQEKVAETMGKSRSLVANKLRLLTLPAEMKRALKDETITEGHAKALLAIADEGKREVLFNEIISGNLNVRETEKVAGSIKKGKINKTKKEEPYKELASDLAEYLGTKVAIKSKSKGGKVEIDYYSAEELDRIYSKIKG
ncbi:MAG: ParB/RepB/Spo0J family partition protein [Patescibacteria group bacterium]|nr:ParB/RepB/Spo0J family partition protein [Patescibacteria group bacterium]